MRRALGIYFFLIVMVTSLIGGSVFTTYSEFVSEGPLTQSKEVVIPKGKGVRKIARLLFHEGVISSPAVFLLGLRANGKINAIKAGEYSFPAHASAKMVMDILVSGNTYIRKFVVPEGLTSAQIVALMDKAKGLKGDVLKTPKDGTLLPDTYHYSYGDTKEGMLKRMKNAMTRTLNDLWEKRAENLPFKTPKEAVILASLVEKETGIKSERALIASAFVNRLNKGMKLQSDPTVIYALTEGAYELKRRLTYSDLKYQSPYNTYVVTGLPKGAIANPGREAINAVLHPANTKYIYFVANGTGGHTFAEHYSDHQNNVKNWRAITKNKENESEKTAQ